MGADNWDISQEIAMKRTETMGRGSDAMAAENQATQSKNVLNPHRPLIRKGNPIAPSV